MHEQFMREAIKLAEEKMRAGEGGPFGAVIVRNNHILARGWNQVTSKNDPTAHAEITAIRAACKTLDSFQLSGCEIYANCEPCPMCLAALYWSRIDAVYYAANRTDAAAIGFDDRYIYQEINKALNKRDLPIRQLLRQEALPVFQLWQNMSAKTPY